MLEYTNTDQRLHWLCQIIAKANRSYVPKKEDDSHTNLYYDVIGNRITGRWIEASNDMFLLVLNLENLQFEWVNEAQQILQSVSAVGKLSSTIEEELKGGIQKIGLDTNGFTDKLHFEIPEYPFCDEPIKSIGIEQLKEWKYFRKLSNEVCARTVDYLQVASEVRIWPHHFDTGIYVLVTKKVGIGVGLAMEDGMVSSPYFYISGYPTTGNFLYKNLPNLSKGLWETGLWNGAILSLSTLIHLTDKDKNTEINTFLKNGLDWFVQQ